MQKKFWLCTICGDLHVGANPPEVCPTCHQGKEKSVEITFDDMEKELQKYKK